LVQRYVKWLGCGLVLITLAVAGAGYGLARLSCSPDAPWTISRNFIDFVQAGKIADAYALTDRRRSVGRDLAAFDANIRHQLAIDAFPSHRNVEISRNRSDLQSCGNRLRRWILGRKVDPDQISIDYDVGLPFEIRLTSDDNGHWRIIFFQSHAG
jgi:hypothetical protein